MLVLGADTGTTVKTVATAAATAGATAVCGPVCGAVGGALVGAIASLFTGGTPPCDPRSKPLLLQITMLRQQAARVMSQGTGGSVLAMQILNYQVRPLMDKVARYEAECRVKKDPSLARTATAVPTTNATATSAVSRPWYNRPVAYGVGATLVIGAAVLIRALR